MAKVLPIVPSAAPGSMADSPAGLTWRETHPVISDRCNLCLECTLFCPEGALVEEGKQLKVLDSLCKGCAICAVECKEKAIKMAPDFEGERGIFPARGSKS